MWMDTNKELTVYRRHITSADSVSNNEDEDEVKIEKEEDEHRKRARRGEEEVVA